MLLKMIRWSGLAGILGSIFFIIAVILHPLRDAISIVNSGVAYGAIHNLGVIGLMLLLLGLVGQYVQHAEDLGNGGLISFLIAFFGYIFYICLLVVDGLRNPLLARLAPNVVHTTADSDPNLLFIVLIALLMLL